MKKIGLLASLERRFLIFYVNTKKGVPPEPTLLEANINSVIPLELTLLEIKTLFRNFHLCVVKDKSSLSLNFYKRCLIQTQHLD